MKNNSNQLFSKSESITRILNILLILLFCSFNIQSGRAQSETELLTPYAEQLEELVSAYYENGQFQGAVMVVMDGEIVLRKAFGYANIEWKILNTPETKFTIASLGKAFTATIILQLVEEKKSSWMILSQNI